MSYCWFVGDPPTKPSVLSYLHNLQSTISTCICKECIVNGMQGPQSASIVTLIHVHWDLVILCTLAMLLNVGVWREIVEIGARTVKCLTSLWLRSYSNASCHTSSLKATELKYIGDPSQKYHPSWKHSSWHHNVHFVSSSFFFFVTSFKGGWVGDPEVGFGQIFQQVRRNLQWWEQTQTLYSYSPDRLSSSDLSGEIQLYWCVVHGENVICFCFIKT